MSRTDRQTDGRTDGRHYDSNTALALRASRGKNAKCTVQYKEVCYGSWQTAEDSGPLFESVVIPTIPKYTVVRRP